MIRLTAGLVPLLALLLATPLAADGDGSGSAAPGAESPQKLMTALSAAFESGEKERVLALIDQTRHGKAIPNVMAETFLIGHRYLALIAKTEKRHGKDLAALVKHHGGFLSMMRIPVEKLAKGTLEKGENGAATLSVEEKIPGGTDRSEVQIVEIGGRWFLDANPGSGEKAERMLALLKVMLPAGNTLIAAIEKALAAPGNEDSHREAFKTAVEAAGETYSGVMQDAMRRMQAPPEKKDPPKKKSGQ